MTRVLVICNAPARIQEQVAMALALSARGDYAFRFACSEEIPRALLDRIREAGFRGVVLDAAGKLVEAAPAGHGESAPPGRSVKARLKGLRIFPRLKLLLHWNSVSQALLEKRLRRRLDRLRAAGTRLMEEFRPNAVLAFGDRHGDIEAVLAVLAREAGIPVILPYFAYSDMKSLVRQRAGNPLLRMSPFSPLYAKRLYAQPWARNLARDGIAYYMPFEVSAYRRIGALSANPWTLGCGLSDVLCVDSQDTVDRYVAYGVPPEKLRIVGDATSDILHGVYGRKEAVEREVRARYALAEAKEIVLVSLPQLAEHGLLPWDRHFREVDFLMERLAALGKNLLVSLHPKMERPRYAYLEEKYGCRILDERLSQVLPSADLFVATYSSTVMWAVLCGIPSVVVDFYGLDLGMFGFLSSPRVVVRREDLDGALRAALAGPTEFSRDWASLSRDAVFDGRTMDRYHAIIEETKREPAAGRPAPATAREEG